MLFRLLRSVNEWFAIVLLWVYVLAFLAAMPMMFVFPLAPLGLLAAGLCSLGVAVMISAALRAGQRGSARHTIAGGTCPVCGGPWPRTDPTQWPQRCSKCQTEFAASGEELKVDPRLISGTP